MEQFLASVGSPEAWVALLTLTLLEIVLGIDNIVFISIIAGRLPDEQQAKGRTVGLMLALVTRILLLLSIVWIMRLTRPLFEVMGYSLSGKDLILLGGGLFLLFKATHEIHNKLEGEEEHHDVKKKRATFGSVVFQIMIIDIVFSLDSVITAVGMTKYLWVMITAVVIAIGFMLAFAGWVANYIERHPTVKMLALSFLVLIGVNLIAEGLGHHIPRGYTYFAMAFSVGVEMLNLKIRRSKAEPPVHLKRNAPEGEA
jgi:predicted tellurium resistance membrane protein TerC